MPRDDVPHLIDGEETISAGDQWFDNVNPWTREPQCRVALGSAADVEQAVVAARKAFRTGPWPRMSLAERGVVLTRLADLIQERAQNFALADTSDVGKPVSGTQRIDVPRSVATFKFFGDHARLLTADTYPVDDNHHLYSRFEPAGVVGVMTPWNFPLLLEAWKVAPALAWGNSVVLKPAEDSPSSAHLLAEAALDAGVPAGVLNVVQGTGPETGQALIGSADIDRLTFTGSTATGRRVARAASDHLTPVHLELGGKGANLVFSDADLEAAVTWSIKAAFHNSGQVCLSGSRIYVQREVYESFTTRLVEAAQALCVGDPADPRTEVGPLASKHHFDKVNHYFDLIPGEGGNVLAGGPGDGWTFRPTVVTDVRPTGRVCTEEIFGPLVVVAPFDDDDEAVSLANSSSYGLSALVFTQNLARAHKVSAALRAGTVWVNCFQVRDYRAPFGGPGSSGLGRDGGHFSRDFLTEPKLVAVGLG